jgi:hypothetical protein
MNDKQETAAPFSGYRVTLASGSSLQESVEVVWEHPVLLPRPPHSGLRPAMSAALGFVWRSPSIRTALLANAVIGLLAFNFPTFYASISSLTFKQPSLFGLAESLNAVTSLGAGVSPGPQRPAANLTHRRIRRGVSWQLTGLEPSV